MKPGGRLGLPVLLALAPLIGGCVATAIAGVTLAVVKAPFQVAGAGIDAVTTSQQEADEKRGREARKAEEKAAKDAKKAEKARKQAGKLQDDEVTGGAPQSR